MGSLLECPTSHPQRRKTISSFPPNVATDKTAFITTTPKVSTYDNNKTRCLKTTINVDTSAKQEQQNRIFFVTSSEIGSHCHCHGSCKILRGSKEAKCKSFLPFNTFGIGPGSEFFNPSALVDNVRSSK